VTYDLPIETKGSRNGEGALRGRLGVIQRHRYQVIRDLKGTVFPLAILGK